MFQSKTTYFCLFLAIIVVFFSGTAKAQESFSGGQGSNLAIKTGILKINREDLEIKLHPGFAEVKQSYIFKNEKNSPQLTSFGFSYKLNSKNTGLENIAITIDNTPVNFISSKEINAESITNWKTFETEFTPNQTRIITITHWQQNNASLRGMRSFSYNLKNKLSGPIGEFNLKLYLMDGISLNQFDKTINPDLDLKLEPFGWKNQDSSLVWQWKDFTPGFDIMANFYWPNGDLAKISQLNQNIGLYNIKSNINSTTAFNLVDSSYLTDWQVDNFNQSTKPKITIDFGKLKDIDEFRIIPGKANSLDDFESLARPKNLKLSFDNDETKTIELSDNLKVQTIKLPEHIKAKIATITVDSVYPGKIKPNTLSISEIEFGTTPSEITINNTQDKSKQSVWQKIFVDPIKNMSNFFKNIF